MMVYKKHALDVSEKKICGVMERIGSMWKGHMIRVHVPFFDMETGIRECDEYESSIEAGFVFVGIVGKDRRL